MSTARSELVFTRRRSPRLRDRPRGRQCAAADPADRLMQALTRSSSGRRKQDASPTGRTGSGAGSRVTPEAALIKQREACSSGRQDNNGSVNLAEFNAPVSPGLSKPTARGACPVDTIGRQGQPGRESRARHVQSTAPTPIGRQESLADKGRREPRRCRSGTERF